MDNFSPVQEPEISLFARMRQKFILLAAIIISAMVVFTVVQRIKPVSLRNLPSLAAPVINLNWQLQEPDATVRSEIYRSTSEFFDEPTTTAFLASVPSPQASYSDTSVVDGTAYYYSIFEIDADGNFFDPSYFTLSATTASLPPPASPPTVVTLANWANFKCDNAATVYVYNNGNKEVYPEAAIFLAWNQSFANVQTITAAQCATIPGSAWVRLPENSLVKVNEGPTVWLTQCTTARPIASLAALYHISSQPKIITISINYLHSYSGGAVIN